MCLAAAVIADIQVRLSITLRTAFEPIRYGYLDLVAIDLGGLWLIFGGVVVNIFN